MRIANVSISVSAVTAAAAALGALAAGCYIFADHEALRGRIRKLMQKSLPILKSSGARHFITFGTLLGRVRENNVIYGDTDGDIGVLAADAHLVTSMKSAFEKSDVLLQVCGDHLLRLRDAHAPYVYIDLYLLDGDTSLRPDGKFVSDTLGAKLWNGKDRSVPLPTNLVFPLVLTKFLGVTTFMPKKAAELLEHIYGGDWRTPRRHDKGVHGRLILSRIFGNMLTLRLGVSQFIYGK